MEDGRDPAWLAICTCGAWAEELLLLELQVSQRRIEWLPRNHSGFSLPWFLHSHPSHSGPSSNTVSLTTPSAADTMDPLNLPAASTDSLHTAEASHPKSGTCISLLGTLWQWELMHGAGWKHLEAIHNQWGDKLADGLYSHFLIATPFLSQNIVLS